MANGPRVQNLEVERFFEFIFLEVDAFLSLFFEVDAFLTFVF